MGGPPIFNFLLYVDTKQGYCKIHLSFYFWDKLLFWANTLQSRQGITLGRHNAVGPPPGIRVDRRSLRPPVVSIKLVFVGEASVWPWKPNICPVGSAI